MTPTCPLCSRPRCKHWAPLGTPVDFGPLVPWRSAPSLIIDEAENEREIVRAGLAYRAWRRLWLGGLS